MPVILQYVFESILYFIDTMFVSWLGEHALSGVATALYLYFLFKSPVISAFISSYTTLTSQAWGSGRKEVISQVFSLFLYLCLAAQTAVALLLVFLGRDLMLLIFPDVESVDVGYRYLLYCLTSVPGSALFVTFLAVLYGTGRTWQSAAAWILSDIVNAVLDPILMFKLGLGVIGAALAFSISVYVPLPLLYYFTRDLIKLEMSCIRYLRQILRVLRDVGLPVYLERLMSALLFTAYGAAIGRYGLETYTAYQIGLRIESFIYLPVLAFADIANIVIGQEVGSGRTGNIVKTYNSILALALLFTGLASVIVIGALPLYIWLFTESTHMQKLVLEYLILAALSDLGLAVEMSGRGAYRAIGRAYIAAALSLTTMLLARVVPAYIALSLNLPITYVWAFMVLDTGLRAGLIYISYVTWASRRPVVYV